MSATRVAVIEAHLLTRGRGHHRLAAELFGGDAIVAELRDTLPGVLPDGDASIHEAMASEGANAADSKPLDDDTTAVRAAAIADAMLDAWRCRGTTRSHRR